MGSLRRVGIFQTYTIHRKQQTALPTPTGIDSSVLIVIQKQ